MADILGMRIVLQVPSDKMSPRVATVQFNGFHVYSLLCLFLFLPFLFLPLSVRGLGGLGWVCVLDSPPRRRCLERCFPMGFLHENNDKKTKKSYHTHAHARTHTHHNAGSLCVPLPLFSIFVYDSFDSASKSKSCVVTGAFISVVVFE